jgi:hypothetical protein
MSSHLKERIQIEIGKEDLMERKEVKMKEEI